MRKNYRILGSVGVVTRIASSVPPFFLVLFCKVASLKICLCADVSTRTFFKLFWSSDVLKIISLKWNKKIKKSPRFHLTSTSHSSSRISPACSTPSTRSWTPPSTTPPAAARRCGSSSRWLPTPASGGGAARRARQVKLAPARWVGSRGEDERAFLGVPPSLSCLLSAHPDMCLLSRRKASASGLSELCSSQSRRRSISPTQWGSFLMMGGVTELREAPPPLPSSAPSNTLKETLRDVPSPFDNHSHFSFSPKFPFFPSPFPPSVLRAAGENIAAFNLTFLTDDLVNKQSGRKYLQKKYIFLCVCVLLFRL